jgi:hypothetical protein
MALVQDLLLQVVKLLIHPVHSLPLQVSPPFLSAWLVVVVQVRRALVRVQAMVEPLGVIIIQQLYLSAVAHLTL